MRLAQDKLMTASMPRDAGVTCGSHAVTLISQDMFEPETDAPSPARRSTARRSSGQRD